MIDEKKVVVDTDDLKQKEVPEISKTIDIFLLQKFKNKYFIYDKILIGVSDPKNNIKFDSSKYDKIKISMLKENVPIDFINTVIIDDYNFDDKTITQ